MTFKPGQSGNPSGKSKFQLLTDDLRRVAAQSPAKIRKISEHILQEAENGDLAYIQFLYDRLEGKPTQRTEQETTITIEDAERIKRIAELERAAKLRPMIDITPDKT